MPKRTPNTAKPAGGLYEGDAGAPAAANDPLGFYTFTLANEGRTGMNTAPDAWNYLMHQGFQNIFDQYMSAQGANEDLTFLDHMANTYGAARTPTARNPFAASSALTPAAAPATAAPPRKRRRRR